jgi:hypothetical protein
MLPSTAPPRLSAPSPVTFAIVSGNDNGGQPALHMNATTGVVTTASLHDYETTPRVYTLNVSLTDDGTALYGGRGRLTTYWTIVFHVQVRARMRSCVCLIDCVFVRSRACACAIACVWVDG